MNNKISEDITDVLQIPLKPRDEILSPWLYSKSYTMLFSKAGEGKTWFATGIAYAAATGTDFLKWKNVRRAKVCYIDGEMGREDFARRLWAFDNASNSGISEGWFDFLCFENHTQGSLPNLAAEANHSWYWDHIADAEVVVFDNLLSLTARRDRYDCDETLWTEALDPFFIKLRKAGKAVILVHHSGKSGDQLGTSTRRKSLDFEIKLSSAMPTSHERSAFQVEFSKVRSLPGGKLENLFCEFSIELSDFTYGEGMRIVWHSEELLTQKRLRIANLADRGLTPQLIAWKTNCDVMFVKDVLEQRERTLKESTVDEEENF